MIIFIYFKINIRVCSTLKEMSFEFRYPRVSTILECAFLGPFLGSFPGSYCSEQRIGQKRKQQDVVFIKGKTRRKKKIVGQLKQKKKYTAECRGLPKRIIAASMLTVSPILISNPGCAIRNRLIYCQEELSYHSLVGARGRAQKLLCT